ncbi:MAG: hypothetical protein ACOY16_09235 [Chloroflexota bacterium]
MMNSRFFIDARKVSPVDVVSYPGHAVLAIVENTRMADATALAVATERSEVRERGVWGENHGWKIGTMQELRCEMIRNGLHSFFANVPIWHIRMCQFGTMESKKNSFRKCKKPTFSHRLQQILHKKYRLRASRARQRLTPLTQVIFVVFC